MTRQNEFVNYLLELLKPFGNVSSSAMFGGHGIYKDGLIFGIVLDDTFYPKAGEVNRDEFAERGLGPCVYQSKSKAMQVSLGYYQCPEEALESSAPMRDWAKSGYAAALRAVTRKKAVNRRAAKSSANSLAVKRTPRKAKTI